MIVLNARNAVTGRDPRLAGHGRIPGRRHDPPSDTASPDTLLQTLDLRFKVLRHVRVAVRDADGDEVGAPIGRTGPSARRPHWFADLIMPPIERTPCRSSSTGRTIGTAQITTQPMDEIDEIWGYARALSLTTWRSTPRC